MKISTKKILELFTLLSLGLVFIHPAINVQLQNQSSTGERGQYIFEPNPLQVAKKRTETFRIYYPYINPYQKPLAKVVMEVRMNGKGFQLVPNQHADIYQPQDLSRGTDSPKPVNCSNLGDIPLHPISVPVSNQSSFIYGLQSSKETLTPGGSEIGELPPSGSGCIQITLQVSPDAIIGDQSQLLVNWYDQLENDSLKQPLIGIYNLEVVNEDSLSVDSCGVEEKLENGVCVPNSCPDGQILFSEGRCIAVVDEVIENMPEVKAENAQESKPNNSFNTNAWLLSLSTGTLIVSLGILFTAIRNYLRYSR